MLERKQASGNTLGDISVLYLTVMQRALTHRGVDPAPLFAQFGIDDQLLSAPDARISIPRFMRLGQSAITLSGDPCLGLWMGDHTRPADLGLAGLAGATAANAEAALRTLIRFSLLTSYNSRGQPTFIAEQSLAGFYSIRPYNIFNFFVVDSVLAAWVRYLRDVTGEHRVAKRVDIEYPEPPHSEQFRSWFDCPVRFGAERNQLVLRPEILMLPSVQAQPAVHTQLREICETKLRRIHAGWSITEKVRDALARMLSGQTPQLESVAKQLGLTSWNLQRQLAARGSSFTLLLDETRQSLAAIYLRETSLSLSEIAWVLGFANASAFQKAYKRWHGISPGFHRDAMKLQQGGN
ncbi:MAG: AraC family transcriptional regulator [Marinobacter sp.]|nr:AraC family transcriptional regulator [Marinobacter sp.]